MGREAAGPLSGCSRAWRWASPRTTASKWASLGRASPPSACAGPRSRSFAARPGGRGEAAGALGGAEDVLLGVGPVRHLGGDVQPLREQGDDRLVVLDAGRL